MDNMNIDTDVIVEIPSNNDDTSSNTTPVNPQPDNLRVNEHQIHELFGIEEGETLTPEELIQLELIHLQERDPNFAQQYGDLILNNYQQSNRNRNQINNNNNNLQPNINNPNNGQQEQNVAQNLMNLLNPGLPVPLIGNNQNNDGQDRQGEVEANEQEQDEVDGNGNVRGTRWSRGLSNLNTVYFVCENVALIMALIMDSKNDCASFKLRKWCIGQISIQFLMVISNIIVAKIKRNQHGMTPERRTQISNITYIISKLLNVFWACWVLLGIIWTFQARSCASHGNSIFLICYILAIWHIVLLGFLVLGCICCLNIILIYLCCGKKSPNKASNRLIKKMTTQKVYKEGLVPKDDSTCAICLSDYEEGDKLRFLRCEHHFHGECIVQWLKKNKSCPFCKREIDFDIQKEIKNDKKETQNDTSLIIDGTVDNGDIDLESNRDGGGGGISEANDDIISENVTEEEEQEVQLIRRT